MGLRSLGGGGQFQGAIQKILEIEREPIRTLQNRRQIVEAKQKNFQTFKIAVGDLQGALMQISGVQALREFKVDLGDGEGLIDVTLDKAKVQPGTYELEIEELAESSAMITNGFEDPKATRLGIGYVQIYGPEEDFEIFVDSDNASLRGIAGLINSHPESPVRATVIRDDYDQDSPWRLMMTAKKGGDPNNLQFPEFYFLNGRDDIWIDQDRSASNALLKVDGFEIDTQSNEVTDFIDGINVAFKQARPGRPFSMTITEDFEKVDLKISEFVDKMNGVLKFIKDQNTVDEGTDTRTMFTGDTSLQNIEWRLRNLIHEGYMVDDETKVVHLNEIGIVFSREGLLQHDPDKIKDAMAEDFEAVAEAVSGPKGFAYQLSTVLKGYTRAGDGILAIKESTFRNQIDRIDDDIANKERALEQRQQNLIQQFSRLQSSLSNMQQQQQFMQSQLGGGGGMIQQLMG